MMLEVKQAPGMKRQVAVVGSVVCHQAARGRLVVVRSALVVVALLHPLAAGQDQDLGQGRVQVPGQDHDQGRLPVARLAAERAVPAPSAVRSRAVEALPSGAAGAPRLALNVVPAADHPLIVLSLKVTVEITVVLLPQQVHHLLHRNSVICSELWSSIGLLYLVIMDKQHSRVFFNYFSSRPQLAGLNCGSYSASLQSVLPN